MKPKPNDYIFRNIPDDLWKAVKHRAVDEQTTIKQIIINALEEYIERGRK